MGVEEKGQVCIMIHSGSRGLGHQVATDALVEMEKAMKRDKIHVNDRQVCIIISLYIYIVLSIVHLHTVHLSIQYPFVYPSIYSHPSNHLLVHASIHSFTYPLIHPSTHPSIHPFIHPFIHHVACLCSYKIKRRPELFTVNGCCC